MKMVSVNGRPDEHDPTYDPADDEDEANDSSPNIKEAIIFALAAAAAFMLLGQVQDRADLFAPPSRSVVMSSSADAPPPAASEAGNSSKKGVAAAPQPRESSAASSR